jgi:hypothetical protein
VRLQLSSSHQYLLKMHAFCPGENPSPRKVTLVPLTDSERRKNLLRQIHLDPSGRKKQTTQRENPHWLCFPYDTLLSTFPSLTDNLRSEERLDVYTIFTHGVTQHDGQRRESCAIHRATAGHDGRASDDVDAECAAPTPVPVHGSSSRGGGVAGLHAQVSSQESTRQPHARNCRPRSPL